MNVGAVWGFSRHRLYLGLFIALAALAADLPVQAQQVRAANVAPQKYSIAAGELGDALNQLAAQSQMQIVYAPELVQGKTAPAINGQLTWRDALQKLLAGSGLEWSLVGDNLVAVRKAAAPQQPANANEKRPSKPKASKPKVQQLEQVTVTGTRIRGGVTASPTITIGAQQIQQEGFTDLGQVIRSIPQNFSGGQNPGVIAAGGNHGNYNQTSGSALNLRGLGADASLTLLNGRRVPYDGFTQAVDISAIPVEAVERLEIIPDGASAIYGSDAVGGVANVILKRDFNGVTLGARYGGATEGGLATREYTATAGTTWASGGLIATLKDAHVDPIYARQRSYTGYMFEPTTLYPGSDLRNGLVSVHQSMGDVAELRLDVLRTKRDVTQYEGLTTDSYYYLSPEVSITVVSPSIAFSLPHDWSLTLGGAYGRDDEVATYTVVSAAGRSLNTHPLNNESRSWQIGAEGPLFRVGGGNARLAIGAGARKYEYFTGDYGGDESVRFAYAELELPVVSAASGIPGVHRLEFSAALRGEDYTSFGGLTTPKFGVIYDPTADFTFKTSWGKSFKAPTAEQRFIGRYVNLYSASALGGIGLPADATALVFYGGNPAGLRPERARTWTTSLALHPEALPRLDAELTWFDIDYTDRVDYPVEQSQALSNPIYAGFVDRSPTPEQIQDLLSVYNDGFFNASGAAYDPSKVVAIIHNQYANAARQWIKGFDLSGSYRFDLGSGRLMVRGSVGWLDSTQALTAAQSPYDLAGTLFYPAKISSRVGAVWNQGGFTASLFGNYKSGVTNTADDRKGASFTTFDATLRYNTGARDDAWSKLTLELSVQNLLDRTPPLYTVPSAIYVPYDSTNYSAIGRFVSISVSKHW